ncbi:MAG: histidine--tRNA ligase [Bdellovibrionaceae bacterium]|nr:histidine--tRNA ligase [Pseudobdellovibrionaceae bacterium]
MEKIQAVRGTKDLFPLEQSVHRYIIETALHTAKLYNFKEVSTPIMEFSQVFKRTLGDFSDIVNKEMYTFLDRKNKELTLRPEGTAGIVRAILSEGLLQDLPIKYFYHGPMFRYERPQKGRQRQFHQLGVEHITVEKSPQADVEIIAQAQLFLSNLLGNNKDQWVLEVNSLGNTKDRESYIKELTKYLKKHQNQLSPDSVKRLETNPLRILDSKSQDDQQIISNAPCLTDFLCKESLQYFQQVKDLLNAFGIAFKENPQLVRGLDYYSHSIFEFKSHLLGAQSTLLAGGRYDQLMALMGGPNYSGIGWAAGIERLSLMVQEQQALMQVLKNRVTLALLPVSQQEEFFCLELAQELRKNTISVELIFQGNISKKIKKAVKINSVYNILIGPEEIQSQTYIIKNTSTKKENTITHKDLISFLKKNTN